jgi:hypothetical protein
MRRVMHRGFGPGLLLLLLSVFAAPAQPAATTPSVSPNPQVKAYVRGVKDEQRSVPLDIRKLEVEVAVRGGVAVTEVTFDVVAPAAISEPLEGRLHLDLPPGSVVTGYALDVKGGMVDGSLVDQSKARSAYEQQVRGEVDPGFTEVDQEGGFNTRIFPIDNKNGRRVRLRFVSAFADEYRFPLRLAGKTELSVRVTYPGIRNPPQAKMDGVRFEREAGLAVANVKGPVDTVLRVGLAPNSNGVVSTHSSGEAYWQLSGQLRGQAAARGDALRIYWDRSRSRRDHDHRAELARVREAIAALKPASIEWVAFASGTAERAKTSGDADLVQHVAKLRYGGATSFTALGEDSATGNCLLVSDGRVTYGTAMPSFRCRVFAIAPSTANIAVLQHMADSTGGRVISGPTQPADWLRPSVTSVATNGNKTSFVSLPAPSGWWRIAFAAPKDAKVVVSVRGEEPLTYSALPWANFGGEAALVAASRLALLEDPANRKEFMELSRRYAVASATVSFVVLEEPEDYVRAEITPPPNYTRREEWAQLAAEAAEDKEEKKKNRFGELLKDWNEQVAWWNKKFDVSARPKAAESDKRARPAASPPPVPLRPQPPADAAATEAPTERVTVTGSRLPQRGLTSTSPVADVSIAVSAWRPQRDYLDAFDADPSAFDRVFPEWDKKAGDVPSFYLDTADWLYRKGRKALAVETLLSALDLPTANEVTLGMVAARLERYGLIDPAILLRERHALLDPDHPQPRRLLALALAKRAELVGPTIARDDLKRAITLLTDIAQNPIADPWHGIDMVSLVEANALLVKLKALGGSFPLDPRLTKNLDSDVRVVLDWSNDAADIDLWVDEPNGERAFYDYPRTLIGGHVSDDMTSGFGPEEYFLRKAAKGRYTVRANVYSPDQLDPNGTSRVTAHLFRDWGRPGQRVESIDLDLQRGQNGEMKIGTLKVE